MLFSPSSLFSSLTPLSQLASLRVRSSIRLREIFLCAHRRDGEAIATECLPPFCSLPPSHHPSESLRQGTVHLLSGIPSFFLLSPLLALCLASYALLFFAVSLRSVFSPLVKIRGNIMRAPRGDTSARHCFSAVKFHEDSSRPRAHF